jgi:HPt (histidine-containing phosphotransfer) domain-containing protein
MATQIDTAFFARLNALNDKFAASVPATLAGLRTKRLAFKPDAPDPELIKEIHQILHTIAGSAATFGFRILGQKAREIEQQLRVLMAFDHIAAIDWENWLMTLDEYVSWGEIDPKADYYIDEQPQ